MTRPQPLPMYLTAAELAARLRVSKMTVYRLIKRGELPAVRIGRSFRITRSAYVGYVRDAQVGGPE